MTVTGRGSSKIFTTNLGSIAGRRLTTRAHCGGWLWNGWGISPESGTLDWWIGSFFFLLLLLLFFFWGGRGRGGGTLGQTWFIGSFPMKKAAILGEVFRWTFSIKRLMQTTEGMIVSTFSDFILDLFYLDDRKSIKDQLGYFWKKNTEQRNQIISLYPRT